AGRLDEPDEVTKKLRQLEFLCDQRTWVADAVQRKERIRQDRRQRRLPEIVEMPNYVLPRFGSALTAHAWHRSEPLPGFGRMIAMQLLREDD
ncbi:MAG: hypothetical protein AAF899_20350, partial [Pseudomonadota bacterium]